jgi:hypothetical protein
VGARHEQSWYLGRMPRFVFRTLNAATLSAGACTTRSARGTNAPHAHNAKVANLLTLLMLWPNRRRAGSSCEERRATG